MSFERRKLWLWLILLLSWVYVLLAFPQSAQACDTINATNRIVEGICYPAQCKGVNVPGKYWASTKYTYTNADPCWQTDYYDTSDCSGLISTYTCSDTCTPDANGYDTAKCGDAVCANGNMDGTQVCNGVAGWNSQPAWCQGFRCGYTCSGATAYACKEVRPPTGSTAVYKGGTDNGLSACQVACAPTSIN